MADTTLSPNMNLVVPTSSVDPGPDWANNINASLSIVDKHNHSAGQGVAIGPNGMNINADLPFNSNNATAVKTLRFSPQSGAVSGGSNIGALYELGVDLYYIDGNGNQVRITQGGSVTGSSGTITGLPSGTASASFSAGTFTFQSATNTPAAMVNGPVSIGEQVASPHFVTLASPTSLAASYTITFPAALPSGVTFVTLDASGNLAASTNGTTGTGRIVLQTSPTITSPSITTPTINAGIFTNSMECQFLTHARWMATTNSSLVQTPNVGANKILATDINGEINAFSYVGTGSVVLNTAPTISNVTLSGSITVPSLTTSRWVCTTGSDLLQTPALNRKVLATDSGSEITSLSYFGSGPVLTADVIQTFSASSNTTIGFAVPSNANNYLWLVNILGGSGASTPVGSVNVNSATRVEVVVTNSPGLAYTVVLIGMKYQ